MVKSWNIRGLRHSGTQYLVDRDGTIHQTVDPKFAAVHVDINKTKYGVNNNNSIGIEIVRSGSQKYTEAQMDSLSLSYWSLPGLFTCASCTLFLFRFWLALAYTRLIILIFEVVFSVLDDESFQKFLNCYISGVGIIHGFID